jgi:hypothetical protein
MHDLTPVDVGSKEPYCIGFRFERHWMEMGRSMGREAAMGPLFRPLQRRDSKHLFYMCLLFSSSPIAQSHIQKLPDIAVLLNST